jgi:hypothetical protein
MRNAGKPARNSLRKAAEDLCFNAMSQLVFSLFFFQSPQFSPNWGRRTEQIWRRRISNESRLANGKNISLSDFRGKKSVVLVFYRGYW